MGMPPDLPYSLESLDLFKNSSFILLFANARLNFRARLLSLWLSISICNARTAVNKEPPSGYPLSARNFAFDGVSRLRSGPIGHRPKRNGIMRAAQEARLKKSNAPFIVYNQLCVHAMVMPVSAVKRSLWLCEGTVYLMWGGINCANSIRKFRPVSH